MENGKLLKIITEYKETTRKCYENSPLESEERLYQWGRYTAFNDVIKLLINVIKERK